MNRIVTSSSSPPSSHTSPAGLAAEPVRVMTCCKCGNGLESDGGAAAELAAYGYVGTRWYCRLGCPQSRGGWLMTHANRPQPTVAQRGRYGHEAREIRCRRCAQITLTHGNNAKWCPTCKEELHCERERRRTQPVVT